MSLKFELNFGPKFPRKKPNYRDPFQAATIQTSPWGPDRPRVPISTKGRNYTRERRALVEYDRLPSTETFYRLLLPHVGPFRPVYMYLSPFAHSITLPIGKTSRRVFETPGLVIVGGLRAFGRSRGPGAQTLDPGP
jgi:hypothetical protein